MAGKGRIVPQVQTRQLVEKERLQHLPVNHVMPVSSTMLLRWVSIAASLCGLVCADGQYRSRPDLSPPRLNITIPAPVPGNGYIFVCPYSGLVKGGGLDGPEQPAGYIFRDNGDLVWSSLGLLSGWVGNMQVTEYKGEPVISVFQGELDFYHGHGWGQPTLLNQHYDPVRLLRGGNHHIISIHEFRVVNGTTALVEVYEPTVIDLRPYGGLVGQHWIVDGIFQGWFVNSIVEFR